MEKIAAIINMFNNIQANTNNHLGLEATIINKLTGAYYIGRKCRTNKDVDDYLDISDVDINDFKYIFLQLSTPNFFGGVIGDDSIEKVKKMANFKGKLYVMCSDPRIKPINYAKVIYDRDSSLINDEEIKAWDKLIDNAIFLFPGKSLSKFWKDEKYKDFQYFNWFNDIFKSQLHPQLNNVQKKYDVVYYGDRRGSYREKLVVKYMPENEKSLLIGFKQKKIDVPFIKKLKHTELIKKLDECKVSLILADEEHEDNVLTFRLYETLASNCLAAISIEFDPNKEIIKDEVLKDILYVKSKKDVEKLVNSYSQDLIKRQHKEFERLINSK